MEVNVHSTVGLNMCKTIVELLHVMVGNLEVEAKIYDEITNHDVCFDWWSYWPFY